ncbi:hypothetical protein L195_g029216 [Trifolium pratense]|uniref:TIP41-like protein n=1 Tax=Trifolium pratense TaxID=57577 RepID=A0A2K3L455_TRIPR|nr:hypothetical protein L195_g029216 [Trifolium pratense]
MAENLADGEFWLPPQFLSDDDDITTVPFSPKHKPASFLDNDENTLPFPSEFPYGFSSSDLSSPIDSLGGSSETESDEDEQLAAELTRRMAHLILQPDSKETENDNMGRFKTGSPQSTLCAFGSGCNCRKGSSQGNSPNGICEDSSSKATWDLLHAAAGEVERMRLNQQSFNLPNTTTNEQLFAPQRKSSPATVAATLPSKNNNTVATNHEMGFFIQPSFSHQQLQIAQIQMLRQQQMAKNQHSIWGGMQKQCGGVFQQRQNNQMTQNRGKNGGADGRNNNNGALGLSSSAWPTLQHAKNQQFQNQQYGSGMRAVFLGNNSGRRESTGTGVFLPRPVDSRRKPACATALVPARVAQALNLQLEGQPQQQLHRFKITPNVENAAAARLRGNYVISQQKRSSSNNISSSRPQPAVSNEIKLPQEWTY